jgi:hypothetical protein
MTDPDLEPDDSTTRRARRRIHRERRTVAAMIRIFCRGKHGPAADLCPECEALRAYALCRVDRCPFGTAKPTCLNCPVHCYRPEMRERIRQVMRYAGPRMTWRHPWLALLHVLDGRSTAERLG